MPPSLLSRAKPKLLATHRWLALVAGLFLLSQGVTGTLVGFRYELNRLLHPGVMTIIDSGSRASLATVIAAAARAVPGARVVRVDYPRQPDDAYIARMTGANGALFIATVAPDGTVLRAASIWHWPVEAAYQLHENLLLGEVGQRGIGFVGLSLLLVALSGVFYWWPAAGRFGNLLAQALSPKSSGPRAVRDWHRAIGLVAVLYLIPMACLGITMAWSPWIRPLVGLVAPLSPERKLVPRSSCAAQISVDDAVRVGVARHPGQMLKSVRFPSKGRVVATYFRADPDYPLRFTDHVWVDACDGRVLATDEVLASPAGEMFFNWLLPIHTGEWLGLPGRMLSWLAALSLAVMAVLGYVLWFSRLRTRSKRRG